MSGTFTCTLLLSGRPLANSFITCPSTTRVCDYKAALSIANTLASRHAIERVAAKV
jgi:hypothetical protein